MTEYAGLLMTEPLSATLLIAAVLAFLRASDDLDWRWAGAAGLLTGALTLVRAEFIVLLVLLPLLALARRPQELRAAALPALAIALGAVLVIAPWTIRNASALDRFVPVSTGGGKTLYIGTNLEADGDAVKLRAALLAEYPGSRLASSAGARSTTPPTTPSSACCAASPTRRTPAPTPTRCSPGSAASSSATPSPTTRASSSASSGTRPMTPGPSPPARRWTFCPGASFSSR